MFETLTTAVLVLINNYPWCFIYLYMGLWTYICVSCARLESFEGVGWCAIFRGLILGVVFWPIAPCVLLFLDRKD